MSPSRYSITSMEASKPVTSEKPPASRPSISTRYLNFP